jgi:hypothetical protein
LKLSYNIFYHYTYIRHLKKNCPFRVQNAHGYIFNIPLQLSQILFQTPLNNFFYVFTNIKQILQFYRHLTVLAWQYLQTVDFRIRWSWRYTQSLNVMNIHDIEVKYWSCDVPTWITKDGDSATFPRRLFYNLTRGIKILPYFCDFLPIFHFQHFGSPVLYIHVFTTISCTFCGVR